MDYTDWNLCYRENDAYGTARDRYGDQYRATPPLAADYQGMPPMEGNGDYPPRGEDPYGDARPGENPYGRYLGDHRQSPSLG